MDKKRTCDSNHPLGHYSLLAGFVGLLFLLPNAALTQPAINETEIDALFSDWNNDGPGGAVGILRHGELIYGKAFGLADPQTGRLNTLDTQFNIASVSKTFTAFAVLLLEELSSLSLDDDIRSYLPELPDFGETITIYHLLHHLSGLRNWNTAMALKGQGEDSRIDHNQVFEMLTQQRELNHPPGRRETYSNSNYYLLARIVERISGRSFRDFTDEEIFEPLGMSNTFFVDDLDENIAGQAWGHFLRNDGSYVRDMPAHNVFGSGNIVTSMNDFARWEKNLVSPTVGSTDLVRKLYTRGELSSGIKSRFARGLGYSEPYGISSRGMGGSTPGYRSTRSEYPDLGITVVVLANSSFNVSAPAMGILQACCTEEIAAGQAGLESYNARFIEMSEADLARFAGAYRVDDSHDVLFAFANPGTGGLVVTELEFMLRMRPVSELSFESISPINESRATFSFGEEGATSMLVERQGIEFLRANRIAEVEINPSYIEEFVGSYYSEELERGFDLIVRDEVLYRTSAGLPDRQLNGQYQDLFTAAGNTGLLLFERNASNEVTAFRISVAGVNNLLYEKR